ncbi:hypothetical protein DPEC_G00326130 [Dallia pectoralis]|uniref:Uncharacterized protein n=1 Tax=Dallia pectoralis TaxID=75939 RepID=A0ACC2F7S1_DALPE|nr:hypothetical protein DPEC_G00326130 [Dallia pectoralis]
MSPGLGLLTKPRTGDGFQFEPLSYGRKKIPQPQRLGVVHDDPRCGETRVVRGEDTRGVKSGERREETCGETSVFRDKPSDRRCDGHALLFWRLENEDQEWTEVKHRPDLRDTALFTSGEPSRGMYGGPSRFWSIMGCFM